MSNVSVTRKTTIAVKADEISKILRAHFQVPDDAWVEFHFLDYGDTLDRAEISWTVTDEIQQDPPPQPIVVGKLGPRGMSIDQINALILDLEQELRRRDGTLKPDNPMSFFTQSVDSWGAAEWFDRLANAIRKQDEAAVAMRRASEEDKVLREADFDLYRMIAHSSAMRLVRDYEPQVRAALATTEGKDNE